MKKANLAAAILAASSMLGAGAAFASNDPAATGRLMLVTGNVQIQRNVQTDNAMIGGIVGVGDTILTADTGATQWKMSDDSMFAIAPESGFRINKYALHHQGIRRAWRPTPCYRVQCMPLQARLAKAPLQMGRMAFTQLQWGFSILQI